MAVERYAYTHLTAAGTTQVKVGNGTLKRLVINKPVSAGTLSVYDATGSDTSPVIAIVTATADVKPIYLDFDVHFSNGLKVVMVQDMDVTIVWQ